jgi:intein/homing endonuclease
MVKNKPKRLDRARSWRVARRKRKQKLLLTGKSRNRKPRPKHKGRDAEVSKLESKVTPKKVVKKVEKVSKKEVVEDKTE